MEKKLPSTYYEYKRALTDYIVQNGNVMLSEWQMQRFIDHNDLYSRFGITTTEVAKDVATILNQRPKITGPKQPPVYDLPEYKAALTKELLPIAQTGLSDHEIAQFIKSKSFLKPYNIEIEDVRIHLELLTKATWVPLKTTLSNQFLNNRTYHNALCQRLQENKNIPLSDTSIRILIKRGGFDKSCGLDVDTVRQDMYALPNKYNMLVLQGTNTHLKPNAQVPSVKTTVESKRPIVRSENNAVAVQISKTCDETMRSALSAALKGHLDLIADRHRVSGLLKDIFPEHRREVNILLQIYDLGIIDELQRQKEINQLFVQRFIGRSVNEYGTSENLAESMVLLWCFCFGHDCCRIPVVL